VARSPTEMRESLRYALLAEYVDGEPMGRFVRIGAAAKASARAKILALLTLSRTLAHVRGAGLAHRDIKPGNVIVREKDGEPVLFDFGDACSTACDATTSAHAYAALEVWEYDKDDEEGVAASGSRRWAMADIYALGLLGFHFFTVSTPDLVERVRSEAYFRVWKNEASRAMPRCVFAVLDRMTVRLPEDRPTARMLVTQLRDCLQ
jgi:serine/threonine protein kinase, bacterial